MEITLLIKSIAGLAAILGILIFLYFYISKAKKKEKGQSTHNAAEVQPDITTLLGVMKNKKSTTQELKEAVNLVIKYYGKIPPKVGIRASPDFKVYSEMLLRLCHHPNTNKEVILKLDKELERLNPVYKLELDDSMTKGLDTRGM